VTLTFDLLTLKVVSESRVTWATPVPIVPIVVFLGLSVLDLGPMYAIETSDVRRASDVREKHRLMPRLLGAGRNDRCLKHRLLAKSEWQNARKSSACSLQ